MKQAFVAALIIFLGWAVDAIAAEPAADRATTAGAMIQALVDDGIQLDPKYSIPVEDLLKIKQALPEEPRVEPKRPRRLLVFSRAAGFPHDSIPYGAQLFAHMGRKTGAYEAVVSDDPEIFEPDSLMGFDAVLLNNTTGDIFRPADYDDLTSESMAQADAREKRLRVSLRDFVSQGGGLAGIHAATDALYEWPDYGEMIGGYFASHPWNEEVGIQVLEPKHPLTAAFAGDFTIADEIYQFREPYSREKVRVLLALDPERTDMTKEGMIRADGDYAVSWIRDYGYGHVFYCSLGHRHEIFWNPAVVQHFLDGIQFVLGDLEADATPVAAGGTAPEPGEP